MLIIKSTQIKNNAYVAEVALVAISEGFYSKVEVLYCTPHFRVWEEDEADTVYSSLQEAEKEFQFNVEWNQFIAASAKAKLETYLEKCMSPANLIWQKQMEEIKELISLPVLLEIKTLIPKGFEDCDVILYQYSSLLVIEYYPPDGESVGVSLFLGGECVYDEYTHLDSGYFVTPELAIKHYFG